ncbi:hypothetical protein [Agrobacterium rosae]|uniref:Uncharacterized protein n=1 Tax=Agrobacterium rosae TaxID=1972867 RepID=A0AAW9FDT5_9HYPH|nr:hypothetical protein [Agrobacterium rosae]MDX8301301.1 hypothetical protein [Agrobacterium rosae]
MDMDKLRMMGAQARAKLEAQKAFDTLDNEKRIIALLATRLIKVKIAREKSPERYTVTMPDGSTIERTSLLDLNDICIKLRLA